LFSYVQGKATALGTPQQRIEYDLESVERFKRVMQLYLDILPRSRPFYVLNHVVSIWSTVVPWERDDRDWQVSDQPEPVWLALKQYLGEVQALQRETGAPPFRYLLGFEETNGGQDNILWDARMLERVAGWYPDLERVTTAINPYEARMEAPQASVLCTPGHVVPFDDLAYHPADTPAPRRAVYQPDHRFSYGFFLAAVGAEFAYREHFAMAAGNPFNAFDGIDQCTSFPYAAMPGPGGLLPTVLLENCREGIDDYRYIKTLEESIKRAKEGPPAAAEAATEADEFLRLLLDSINPDGDHYVNEVGYWDPEVFDHYRWQIAKHIEALRKRAR
ncbi:MAG TPA: hypothetical protein QGH10_19410, partial [Armatimonadota bacterium]|nr:hypothetical protein [Armatimonadota bacterium]